MQVKINWVEKVVEFKEVYTRKIDRTFNEKLFGNWNYKADDIEVNPMNLQFANDYLIEAMTNLEASEIDELSIKDYDEILKKINEIKSAPLN